MENQAEKVKLSYADFIEVGGVMVAFNCHPEAVKRWAMDGLGAPHVVVIGDTAIDHQVALTCPEFPFLKSIFLQGGFDYKNSRVARPLVLVGDKQRVHAHYDALRLCFPRSFAEHRNKIKTAVNVRDMLLKDQEHLAKKDKDGKVIPFEAYVKQRPFDQETGLAKVAVELPDGDKTKIVTIEICHAGKDRYLVRHEGKDLIVELTAEGLIGPTWPIPVLKNIETPHHFRIFVLGSDSGFGTGPTTSYLLEMNGEYILWDCSAYTAWTLQANGINPGQVKKIILSHGHDDHCNDLIPSALNSHGKVEIMATKEIIYTVQMKLAALMNISVKRLKKLFRWTEIKTSKPVMINGFCFEFHYGFHPIPSLGAKISYNGKRYATITGDTGFATLLEPAMKAGNVSTARATYIMQLLEEDGVEVKLADFGRAMIHGEPEDLAGIEGPHIYMYHTSVLPEELQTKANLVRPGNAYCSKPMNPLAADASLIAQVLQNLGIIESYRWAKNLSQSCEVIGLERDSLVVQHDSKSRDFFYIITHGRFDVVVGNQTVATLGKGEFFGEQALLTGQVRNASVMARTPARLIAIPASLFKEMMDDDESLAQELTYLRDFVCAKIRLETIWGKRLVISQVSYFKKLPSGTKNDLSLRVKELEFSPDEVIVRKGSRTTEVYIVAKGKVEVCLDSVTKNPLLGVYELFGEGTALGYSLDRTADVRAVEHTTVYAIPGEVFRQLYDTIPHVQFELLQLATVRNLVAAEG